MAPHGPWLTVPMSAGVSSGTVQTLEGEEGPGRGRISPNGGVTARAEPGVDVKRKFFTESSVGEEGEPSRAQAEG